MKHKYLDDIGYEETGCGMKKDKRIEEWKNERKIYGFDERETWSLHTTIVALLYERIKMYREITPMDLKQYKFEFDGRIWTEEEIIDFVLESFSNYCVNYYEFKYSKEGEQLTKNAQKSFKLLGEILPCLWW